MKYSGKNSLASFMKYFLLLLEGAAVIVLLGLPKFLGFYLNWIQSVFYSQALYYGLIAILYITGILSVLILDTLRKLFTTMEDANPFIRKNVMALRRMGIYAFIIGAAYVSKIFFLNSFMTMIAVFIFFIAGIFCIVLADLFNQAIKYKEENDLTI
ncbi:Protein of unknown function [Dethiosulfatibacter aminovorans DSM 17477]|uniref:DUF2975 domain-containing protein n=1 Tax=Dethiosulfatibacter aminovorans DSM 17477 TaxID=1121476 RepID=A0A1M6L139_9FIRM|nr:DUF2975 domain-containing protein [Dethiosulfatibacter aminovorans]SHJ64931.1 Protein of unknown function [Dethiosulfatibacter aminovorans DSM 17477]